MASSLSNKQLNFARLAIACLDVIKLPLIDILHLNVKADELSDKIKNNQTLKKGRFRLNSKEKAKCCIQPPDIPDYSQFDVTLLCKLISHLCPSIQPRQGWGVEPSDDDEGLGDDIVRIRVLRNEVFAHAASAEIDDEKFEKICDDIERVLTRIQTSIPDCKSVDYVVKLQTVKGLPKDSEECATIKPRLREELQRIAEDITIEVKGKLRRMKRDLTTAVRDGSRKIRDKRDYLDN
ncbi:uncharacterized protein LOC128172489 isoform X2 [Crassostrea angulata]|uniref:uncharacterized protein LOC128172489 isoform X2 n=1 Tax=Magallana angulata TaxID=2784310 RepID=UPI0022B1968C|nr:uncharacterized protein LOC128172489 isoform X2 [Crassostrea angulata]